MPVKLRKSWVRHKSDWHAMPKKRKLERYLNVLLNNDNTFRVGMRQVKWQVAAMNIKRKPGQAYLFHRMRELEVEAPWQNYLYSNGIKPPFFRTFY